MRGGQGKYCWHQHTAVLALSEPFYFYERKTLIALSCFWIPYREDDDDDDGPETVQIGTEFPRSRFRFVYRVKSECCWYSGGYFVTFALC